MIGRNPYKIVYHVIEHVDYINGTHKVLAQSEWLETAEEELNYAVLAEGKMRVHIYKTEINAFGVVMGRERVG